MDLTNAELSKIFFLLLLYPTTSLQGGLPEADTVHANHSVVEQKVLYL